MKTKKIVVLGGSGGGMIAASIIDQFPDMKMLGFLNDNIKPGTLIGRFIINGPYRLFG